MEFFGSAVRSKYHFSSSTWENEKLRMPSRRVAVFLPRSSFTLRLRI